MSNVNGTPNVPELPKPTTFTCGPCKAYYAMGKETTLRVYRHQPWFNHFVTVCPKCGRDYTVWNLNLEGIQYMMVNNTRNKGDRLNVVHSDYCDDKRIQNEFADANNKPRLPDLWISPRKQKKIEGLAGDFNYQINHSDPFDELEGLI